MSTVAEIESALSKLPIEEMQAIRDWLEDQIEDQMEVREDFKAKVGRAQAEMTQNVFSRVRRPNSPA